MCGRYRLARNVYELMEHFGVEESDLNWEPHYNIAPTQEVVTVRQNAREPRRKLSLMRWGLIPYWAQDISIGAKAINAVSETAASKPAFRPPPMATVATGMPLGICTIDSSESKPLKDLLSIGTPITGSEVKAAVTPGRWAAPPAPAMMTRIPRLCAPVA